MATDDLKIEDEEQNEVIESTYIHYSIASYPSDLTLNGIREMWDAGAIVIPPFQRKYVWKKEQASLLIDSFLCGLPVPPVFFYIGEDNRNIVIDGQQRIISIIYFLKGFFGEEDSSAKRQVFRLELPNNSPYNKKTFSELDESLQRKLLYSSILRAINIKQLEPDDEGTSAFRIFERLNTGGTPLTAQEIRNCIYQGDFAELLQYLNRDPNWRKILGKNEPDKHQKDVELILRIFSFVYNHTEYEKPMKEFLNKTMQKYRSGNYKEVKDFTGYFPYLTNLVVELLGEKPFHIRGPLNASALESVMSVIFLHKEHISNDLKEKFSILKASNEFKNLTSLGTTDAAVVTKRRELIEKSLFGI
ncbi:DUF262 domain-containing protein [uncultured Desulfovibrio sp.]|uniref:DUF262 domain-containing protein n=1 Tax=uncultured Desulfovibrio sp. TaxID=167968 RepID=UPI002618FC25|nr:DUF262 domain-containing protein [uncultured Desulfovibrio sp.]